MTRQINQAGLDLIKSFEKLRLIGYLPTPNDKPTAGYGHTGPDVQVGAAYAPSQCEAWLQQDLAWAEQTVETNATIGLTDNQFAALVSLCYNIGSQNFDASTLLRDLNQVDIIDAADQFAVWDKQRGVDLPGLDRRRAAEEALFNS